MKDSIVRNITIYSDSTELNKFGARFKYSKFQKVIDDGHESITSNITTVAMRRDMETFNQFSECKGFVLVIVSTLQVKMVTTLNHLVSQ